MLHTIGWRLHTRNAPFETFHITHKSDGRLELSIPYEPPKVGEGDMCRAMIDRAQGSNPGKTAFTKNELEGATPCPENNSAMNCAASSGRAFWRRCWAPAGKAITRNFTKNMTTKRNPHAQWQ